jgi:hypothetical protein
VLAEATWTGATLRLTVRTRIRAVVAPRVHASCRLVGADGRHVILRVISATPDPEGLRLELELTDVGAVDTSVTIGRFELRLRVGALRWAGPVRSLPAALPAPHAAAGSWWQLRGVPGDLGLECLANPVIVDSVVADGDAFQVRATSVPSGWSLVVERPDPSPDLPLAPGDGPLRCDADRLVAGDPADDLVNRTAERPVVAQGPGGSRSPVHLLGEGAAVLVGGLEVSLRRGWLGTLVVGQRPRGSVAMESEVIDAIPGDPGDDTSGSQALSPRRSR